MNDESSSTAVRIIHHGTGILGLFKPAGLNTFGRNSVQGWLLAQRPDLIEVGPAGQQSIVHRLDRGTSGLLLAATNSETYQGVRRAFSEKKVKKTYLALVEGALQETVLVDRPLGSRYRRSSRMHVVRPGRKLRSVQAAKSTVAPLAAVEGYTLCQVDIATGVRHQVRLHLAHLGHPVVGDDLYGAKDLAGLDTGFFLHAFRVRLADLTGQAAIDWRCPLPSDRRLRLRNLGFPDWQDHQLPLVNLDLDP